MQYSYSKECTASGGDAPVLELWGVQSYSFVAITPGSSLNQLVLGPSSISLAVLWISDSFPLVYLFNSVLPCDSVLPRMNLLRQLYSLDFFKINFYVQVIE